MKRDFFYILSGLMLMTSTTLFAETTGTEIPLREIKSVGMFMPTDSPEQSSDDPPRPNQFHAYIAGQTLSFRIANTNLNHVIVHNPSGVVMLDASFVGDTAFVLPTLGQHIVEIQNAGLHLIGDFNLDPNRQVRSGEPENPNEPPMTLSYTIDFDNINNCYIIEVEYPLFEVEDVVLPTESSPTAQTFNQIVHHDSRIFEYGMENGLPNLPFLSLNLQVPEEATIDTMTAYIEYYSDIYFSYPYAPAQIVPETYDNFPLQYDTDYYNDIIDNVWATPVVISEPYFIRGTTGINVQLRAALYFPHGDIIRPIKKIVFHVCVDADYPLVDMHDETLETPSLNDMVNFYDTYRYIDTIVHPEYKGNFLILATEDYEDEAEYYADHKNNLGFNAWVETLDQYMLDSAFIRQYIKLWYDYEECRPKFVLLIGHEIPYSYGVMNDSLNPPTDMYYACLDYFSNDSIVCYKEKITPDLYVGRWPVHSVGELESIMQKSQEYDLQTPNLRMVLASGTDVDDEAHENLFVASLDTIQAIVEDAAPSITTINYAGRNGFNGQYLKDEFEHYDNSIFVYRGHGAKTCLGAPYNAINSTNLPNNLPYFSFAIGCLMNYPDFGLGTIWTNNGNRSCTFYGATVITFAALNNLLLHNIFRGLRENKNITVGEFIYNGVRRAYESQIRKAYEYKYRRPNLCAYVLNGDPSLYIYGTRLFGDALQHSPANGEKAEDLNNIELKEDIASYALYTISGVLVYSHSGNTDNIMADIEAQNLPDGIYILSAQTKDNSIPSQKIIIQH